MFYALSKLLDVLLSPLWWPLMAFAIGRIAWLRQRAPNGVRALLVLACVLAVCCATQVGAQLLVHAVERGAARTMRNDRRYDAVIVLSGFVYDEALRRHGTPSYGEAVDRLIASYDVLRSDRARVAVLTGSAAGSDPAWSEAAIMARQLEAWGVARERLIEEPRARNTYENAVESARIVRERGLRSLLLVTSAAHMPRAVGCFRAQGLEVDTLPVDYRTGGWLSARWSLLPRAAHLAASEDALRELFGRVVYRLRGYAR